MLFATAPGYGLMMPIVPLVWAAAAAGHEVRLATTDRMCSVAAAAGLPVVDVVPDRAVWQELMATIGRTPDGARRSPYRLFTETMTEGTIAAGRELGADLVVYPSDHKAGQLTAAALGLAGLEVGNRISWSTRDADAPGPLGSSGGEDALREQLVAR